MRRGVVVLVVLGVVLTAVLGGILYGDHRATELAQEHAEQRVLAVLPGAHEVDVQIDTWPLLVSALRGSVEHITVTADHVERGGVVADDVRLEVFGVQLDTGAMLADRRLVVTGIDHAALTGTMSQDAVSLAASTPVEFFAGMVKVIDTRGRTFVATLKVEDRKIRLIPPLPGYPEVRFDLPPEDLLPCDPDVEVLEKHLSLSCEVSELPPMVAQAIGASGQ